MVCADVVFPPRPATLERGAVGSCQEVEEFSEPRGLEGGPASFEESPLEGGGFVAGEGVGI